MHIHAYAWLGEKAVFDKEALRRMPTPLRPPVTAEEQERYRARVDAFRKADVPPVEVANWLVKDPRFVRATFERAEDAVTWLVEQGGQAGSAVERLGQGRDVGVGVYVGRVSFLSLALVTCSPNAAAPLARCPREG
ncbi:hypothetical protein [Streptomyces sp. URMC 129]|uniref:hypothetical protein n=1 Tax=Streptomyces sp. URMC 129 TaxID=3423407 RepID=UPI003F1A6308